MEKFDVYIRVVGCRNTLRMAVFQYEDVSDVLLRFYGSEIDPNPLHYLGTCTITFEENPIALWKNIDFLRDRVSRENPLVVNPPPQRSPPPQRTPSLRLSREKKQSEPKWSPLELPIVRFLDQLFGVKNRDYN